jgi:hypothetical protein
MYKRELVKTELPARSFNKSNPTWPQLEQYRVTLILAEVKKKYRKVKYLCQPA